MRFMINNRCIGPEFPPLIIAEIGINHGGHLDVAIEMADAALSGGAEVIKHQTHVIDDEMSSEAKSVIPGNADISIYEIIKSCALSEEDELKLKNHIEGKGGIFISTPFSRAAANRLNLFGVPAYKIGSGECNNYPLVRHVASFGKPIIISTGMNSFATLDPTVEILRSANLPFALLHCTNIYPTPPEHVRLGAMQEMQERYPDAIIGLSDHTVDNFACLGAVALGASILERHFTDSKDRVGPDIICSMDTRELEELIKGSNIIFKERGGRKGPIEQERETIAFAFASVVAVKDLMPGEVITADNIWVRRPAGGDFSAADFDALLGKRISQFVPSGSRLKRGDVA